MASSWLDGGGSSAKLAALGAGANRGAVGEGLQVLVTLTNPLALQLELSRLRLRFQADAPPAENGDADASPPCARVLSAALVLLSPEPCQYALRCLKILDAGYWCTHALESVLTGNIRRCRSSSLAR